MPSKNERSDERTVTVFAYEVIVKDRNEGQGFFRMGFFRYNSKET